MSVSLDRIELPSDREDATAQAAVWLGEIDFAQPPVAAWIGSQSTLEALDLHGEHEVTPGRLASAIEGAGTGMLALEWLAPKLGSALRGWRGPDQQAAIDQALLAGAQASVEELRRTTPLVERRSSDGALAVEPARGVAAVAIVRRTPVPLDLPRVSVQMLILHVEDENGKVVTAAADSQLGRDAAHDVDAAGGYTLAWELAKLGHSVDRDRGGELFSVGSPWAGAESTEAELPLSEIGDLEGEPGPGERSSIDRAGRGAVDQYTALVRERLLGAWEDFLILQGRAGDRVPHVREESELADQIGRVRDLEMALLELGDVPESEAVREAVTSPLGPERLVLAPPDPFDEVGVLGEQRKQTYRARMQPLAEWLREMPDDWVATRHAELGPPAAHVDRRAARLTGLIESRREAVEQQLREARETGASFDVHGLERTLADVRRQEQDLQAAGAHLDWTLDSDMLIRSAAYSAEHGIRQEFARQLNRDDIHSELSGEPREQLPAEPLQGPEIAAG